MRVLRIELSSVFYFLKDQSTLKANVQPSPYQKPLKYVRPPLIPTEGEQEKQEESFFGSLGKLLANAGASVMDILGGILPGFRRKPQIYEYQSQQHLRHSGTWPVQESFEIRDEDEPPTVEPREPTPRKTYAFMTKDAEKMHQLRQSRAFYNGWDVNFQQQTQKQQQHHHQYQSSAPHTFYEQSCESTGEIVFGAVQEHDKGRQSVIKPVDYGAYTHHNIRNRSNPMGYYNC